MEPCPFCGNSFYKGYKERLTADYIPESGGYLCVILCGCTTTVYGYGRTEEEAIRDAVKRWNTRGGYCERTCKVEHVKSGTLYDVWRYTCCGYEHSESRTDAGASEIPLNFCPDCGARVVGMK